MQQVLVFDEQTNSFKRDYVIEEYVNDYQRWWNRHVGGGELLRDIVRSRK